MTPVTEEAAPPRHQQPRISEETAALWSRRKLRRALSRRDPELVAELKRAMERLRAEAQLKGARDQSAVAGFMEGRAARLSLKLDAIASADPRVRALLDELDARLDRAMLASD